MDHHPLAASLLSRPSFDVVAWVDPVCDAGFPCDSDEALVVLCPVLGPSATMILHRLARYASAGPTTLGARRVRLDVRAVDELVHQPRRRRRSPDSPGSGSPRSARPRWPCARTFRRCPSGGCASLPEYLRDDPTLAA